MPQHYLGPRRQYTVRTSVEVNLDDSARRHGYSSVSRWLADLAYTQVGRDDLALGPDRQEEEDNSQQLRLIG